MIYFLGLKNFALILSAGNFADFSFLYLSSFLVLQNILHCQCYQCFRENSIKTVVRHKYSCAHPQPACLQKVVINTDYFRIYKILCTIAFWGFENSKN